MEIKNYLDSTYLKTAEQSSLSESENKEVVTSVIKEAINCEFKLVMIRSEYVSLAKQLIEKYNSKLLIGTVIDFPKGDGSIEEKIYQASVAISNGVDELDYVVDYEAFKRGEINNVKDQVAQCTKYGLDNNKVVKWIIETAALNDHEIVALTVLIKNCVISHFKEDKFEKIFVKSSTGFYVTHDGSPNGATFQAITLMLENAFPLPVKASGGVKTFEDAVQMINLGVKRIGTSSAKAIVDKLISNSDY